MPDAPDNIIDIVVAIGSDHAGFELKSIVAKHLAEAGWQVLDLGTDSTESVDYPNYGRAVGQAVTSGQARFGVAICGTGIGISISANKVHGVRAALVHDLTTARLAREHNDANICCLGSRILGEQVALDAIDEFLKTPFSGGERHIRRIAEIAQLDKES